MTDIGQAILDAPIPERWKREALPLFLRTHDFQRILGWHELYNHALGVAGDIVEFGVGYGRDLNILACLRELLEPNAPRRIVGFDMFSGGLREDDIGEADGPKAEPGYYEVDREYMKFLHQRLTGHPHPSSDHIVFDIRVGPVQESLPKFLDSYEGTFGLVFFDMLVEAPTRFALEAIRDRLTRGSVVGFNQFCTPYWQGEAKAFRDMFSFRGVRLRRSSYHRYWTWLVIE